MLLKIMKELGANKRGRYGYLLKKPTKGPLSNWKEGKDK
jgi:hypothetical protein